MKKDWPTKTKDLQIARAIIEEYAVGQETDTLGLFELVVNEKDKEMNFRIAPWVTALAQRYVSMYGLNQGDEITRMVISKCLIQNQTVH